MYTVLCTSRNCNISNNITNSYYSEILFDILIMTVLRLFLVSAPLRPTTKNILDMQIGRNNFGNILHTNVLLLLRLILVQEVAIMVNMKLKPYFLLIF